MDERRVLLTAMYTVLICTLVIGVSQFLLVSHIRPPDRTTDPTARASSGIMTFCINNPPSIIVPCNATMVQNSSYYCRLNYTDAQNDSVVFYMPLSVNNIFNLSSSGIINFTPTNDDVGNHTAEFIVADLSGCSNNEDREYFNFTVLNINDPPYLIKPVPNQQFATNKTLSAFFLDTYFADPDGDPLTYTSTPLSDVEIQILPTSEVRFFSSACPSPQSIVFTATDPYDASADSNEVTITVDCQTAGGSNNSAGGGGAGGGGGTNDACQSLWECDDWLPCLPTGFQWQHCYDLHGCEEAKYFKRPCTYTGPPPFCAENWLCQGWGKCFMNGSQSRSCRDLQNCGTNITKPPLHQKCKYQPTCDDGIQNGDESGTDCGGSLCPSCAILQNPSPIVGDGGLSAWLIAIIVLSILLASGILHYYRGQIAQGIALLGFLITHRTYKEILLDAPQRNSFFERVLAFEQLLGTDAGQKMTPAAVYSTLANLLRQYFSDALLAREDSSAEEIAERCKVLSLRPETAALINGLFAKLPVLEQEELELDLFFVRATLEELRTAVCLTSDYRHEELLRPVEEVLIDEYMSFYDEIFARAINVLRAVQYDQIEDARKGYLTLLTRYEPLSEAEKEQIYPQLRWLFDTVKFSSEMTGARVVDKSAVPAAA